MRKINAVRRRTVLLVSLLTTTIVAGLGGTPARAGSTTLTPPYNCAVPNSPCQSVATQGSADATTGAMSATAESPASMTITYKPTTWRSSGARAVVHFAGESRNADPNGDDLGDLPFISVQVCADGVCDPRWGTRHGFHGTGPIAGEVSGGTIALPAATVLAVRVVVAVPVAPDRISAIIGRVELEILPAVDITGGPGIDSPHVTSGRPGANEFAFSSPDPSVTFQCKIDARPFESCSQRYRVDFPLADGGHHFTVRGTDGAGSAFDNGVPFVVDATPPDTFITSGPAELTNSRNAAFTFGSTEAGSTFVCRLDSQQNFSLCGGGYTNLTDGLHVLEVRARDAVGNEDPTSATHAWTVDTTPPVPPTITSGPSGTTNAHPLWTYTAEPGARVECHVDEQPPFQCSSPFGVNPLPDGPHTVYLRATDRAGNVGPYATRSWIQDRTPPDTEIFAGPEGAVATNEGLFFFGSPDGGSRFECSLDGADFTACTSPNRRHSLSDGIHVFRARAIDGAGNVDPTPASRSWTIDTVAPNTSITSGPTETTDSQTATLTFASTESGSSFACSLDGADFAPCTSPTTYSGLSSGEHVFRVAAMDAAGNSDFSPATTTWRVGHPPIANDDRKTTAEDTATSISVLRNDVDPDGDALAVVGVAQPAHGATAVNPDGTISYRPALNYNGPDAFTYTVTDGYGGEATGRVFVSVTPVNDRPIAAPDSATTRRTQRVNINVLRNDSDPEGDRLTVKSVGGFTNGGRATINRDQTIRYRPKTGYVGNATFTYTVSDGRGGTATARVTVTMTR